MAMQMLMMHDSGEGRRFVSLSERIDFERKLLSTR
jgi:hypothetical protein